MWLSVKIISKNELQSNLLSGHLSVVDAFSYSLVYAQLMFIC